MLIMEVGMIAATFVLLRSLALFTRHNGRARLDGDGNRRSRGIESSRAPGGSGCRAGLSFTLAFQTFHSVSDEPR